MLYSVTKQPFWINMDMSFYVRLQRIVARNMSIDKTLDELDLQLKGTTISAFVFKNGIKLGVDSRESNEWVRTRNEQWKPTSKL